MVAGRRWGLIPGQTSRLAVGLTDVDMGCPGIEISCFLGTQQSRRFPSATAESDPVSEKRFALFRIQNDGESKTPITPSDISRDTRDT
jgi:hypothetical protein